MPFHVVFFFLKVNSNLNLFVLLFDPEDGGDMFLRITRPCHPDDLALHNHRPEDLISDIAGVREQCN
jgi:hypothetical protein